MSSPPNYYLFYPKLLITFDQIIIYLRSNYYLPSNQIIFFPINNFSPNKNIFSIETKKKNASK